MDKTANVFVLAVYALYPAVAGLLIWWAPVKVWGIVAALAVLAKGLFFHALVTRATKLGGHPLPPRRKAAAAPAEDPTTVTPAALRKLLDRGAR